MYNIEPIFDNRDIKVLITQSVSLLQAADLMDGIPCVRRVIESHLLRANQVLWHQIREQPEGWSDVGIRLQSPVIFREAMVHIIGQWNIPGAIQKERLRRLDNGEIVIRIVREKIGAMNEVKRTLERQLLEFYPLCMFHDEHHGKEPGRHHYASDIYLWQALTLIRQYISSAYMANMNHRAADGGAFLYRQIAAGNVAYMVREDLEAFHQNFAMTQKGKDCFSGAVYFIKQQLRPIVADLLNCELQSDVNPDDYQYLTNTVFGDDEMPW